MSCTDLDRLHAVVSAEISGPPTSRGAGHTFASCHEIASVLELGESRVLVILPEMRWMEHVAPMLVDVLTERGLSVKWERCFVCRVSDAELRFVSLLSHSLLGYSGAAVLVMA